MNLFTRHPASVGESYGQHMLAASSFGWRMVAAGLACLVHGLLPFLFVRTGSQMVLQLHDEMVINRHRRAGSPEAATFRAEGSA